VPVTRLYADHDGHARFEDIEDIEGFGHSSQSQDDDAGSTAFKCLKPDGHRVEVYGEPVVVGSS
jgi:hypothetical protein